VGAQVDLSLSVGKGGFMNGLNCMLVSENARVRKSNHDIVNAMFAQMENTIEDAREKQRRRDRSRRIY